MSWLNLLLAALSCLGQLHVGSAAEKPDLPPTTLELDLIFPRANETHKRTFPFPIVFAIQGAKNLWPYHMMISWDLSTAGYSGVGSFESGDFRDVYQAAPWTSGDVPDSRDPYYLIASTDLVRLNPNVTEFTLQWSLYLPSNCSAGDTSPTSFSSDLEPDFKGNGPVMEGGLLWKVADDAPLNIVPPDGACPNVEIFNERGNTLRVGGTVGREKCIFFDEQNLRPQPNPCAVKASDELASRVAQSMSATSACFSSATASHRLPYPLTGNCPEQEKPSEAERTRGVGFILLLGLSGLVGAMLVVV